MASADLGMSATGGRADRPAPLESADPAPPQPARRRSLAARVRDWLHAARQTLKYGLGAADVGWLSSRLVAARRAMESEDEPVPLFKDPLAEVLVGPRIMWAARAQARAGRPAIDARSSGSSTTADSRADKAAKTGRKGGVSRIAARTLWFDAEVVDGVAGVATSAVDVALSPVDKTAVSLAITRRPHRPATQAVCLGAGMDTRAWRLALPGVAWFEVDAAHVLAAKAAALRRARAEAPAWDGAAGCVRMAAQPGSTHAFPLTVRSYAALAADLNSAGWARSLLDAGFNASTPAVFIAEGLVMYLTADGVASLLADAASIAAPGSVMAVVAATEGAASAARARAGGRGIMAAWTWGCPPDPGPMWAAAGWAVQAVCTRSDIARRWGLAWTEFPVTDAEPCGRGRAERESLFIVAVRE